MWFDYRRFLNADPSDIVGINNIDDLTITIAENHVKLKYQELFTNEVKVTELWEEMGETTFNSTFNVVGVEGFITKASNLQSDLYDFIKVK